MGGLKKRGFNYNQTYAGVSTSRPPPPSFSAPVPSPPVADSSTQAPTLLGTPTPFILWQVHSPTGMSSDPVTTHRSVMASKARQMASTVAEVSIASLLQPPLPVLLLSALVLLSLSIFSLFTPRAARSPPPPQQPSCLANIDTTVVCGKPRHRPPSLLTIGSLLRYVSNFLSSLSHPGRHSSIRDTARLPPPQRADGLGDTGAKPWLHRV